MISGWLIVDKSSGVSSRSVDNEIQKLLKQKKVGHAGTLDPLASGVLPIAVGNATKVLPYMMDGDKGYTVEVAFGKKMSTDDRDGEIITTSDYIPTEEEINNVLDDFRGEQMQTPPLYSAIKINGEPAYKRARRGEKIDIKARPAFVHKLEFVCYKQGVATFKISCKKGYYVRSFARDLGEKLSTYGFVKTLRRTSVSKITLDDAILVEYLLDLPYDDVVENCLKPSGWVLDDIPGLHLTGDEAAKVKNGLARFFPDTSDGTYGLWLDGDLLGFGEVSSGILKPKRILNI